MLSGDDVKRALWRSFIDNANATVDHWQRLFEQPEESQQRLLLRMLSANRDCAFGQAHDFAGIRDSNSFASGYRYIPMPNCSPGSSVRSMNKGRY